MGKGWGPWKKKKRGAYRGGDYGAFPPKKGTPPKTRIERKVKSSEGEGRNLNNTTDEEDRLRDAWRKFRSCG